jgi:6-phosphogluconolactonase (cycloisomerase 2 family)
MNRWGRLGLGLTQLREATRGLPNRLLLTAAVLCLLALLLLSASTFSAFSGATGNPANTLSAGTVSLTDNDAGAAMFALGNLKPGDTDSGCLQVTYTGSLPALVRLYGTTTGTGLDQYVDLKVTRGTIGSGSFDDCTGFTPDATNYLGQGAGVVYNGTLAAFADDWTAGLADPEAWTAGESHAYKFQATLADTNAAQGRSVTQTFTWEARNLASGQLTQLAGTAGCVSETGSGGACADAVALGSPRSLAISPDGEHAYASSSSSNAVTVFDRDPVTGALTQLAGTAGCVSETGTGGACADGVALSGIRGVVVSPDGEHVYTAANGSDAVAAFDRNPVTGALTQLAGTAACVSDTGSGGACVHGVALTDVWGLTISPDGGHVYAVALTSDAVTVFARDPVTGALTQLAGTAGCVSDTGSGGACVDGVALDGPYTVMISADNEYAYVAAVDGDAVAVFDRDPSTGVLTQLAGTAGCVSETGTGGACTDGIALDGVDWMAVSPDGQYAYAGTKNSDSVAVFDRDPATGVLTQLAGTAGCVSETGTGGACADGVALDQVRAVAVSPDGDYLYAVTEFSDAVAVFDRDPGTGQLTQLAGTAGCVSETGTGGACTDGVALDGGHGVTVSPDGDHVYTASLTSGSGAITIFGRTP